MRRMLSGIVIVSVLTGCAVTSVDGVRLPIRSDGFADYVESVFRRQNEISTELAVAIDAESLDSDRYLILEAAEIELLMACRGLNQLAEAQRDGETIGGFGGLKRARGAPDCERAADQAAAALDLR